MYVHNSMTHTHTYIYSINGQDRLHPKALGVLRFAGVGQDTPDSSGEKSPIFFGLLDSLDL